MSIEYAKNLVKNLLQIQHEGSQHLIHQRVLLLVIFREYSFTL